MIKPKKFNDTVKDLTIFAEDKNSEDEFINIYIKKKTANDRFQITFAKKGVFENRGEKKILVLYDGQNLNSNKNKTTNFKFSKSDFGLTNMSSHLFVHKKLQEQSTKSLIKCVDNIYYNKNKKILNCDISNPKMIQELFKRFILPIYIPLLILISCLNLLSLKNKFLIENIEFQLLFLVFWL